MASPVNVEDESAESPAALFFLDMSMKRTPPPMASPSIFFVSKGAPLVRDQKQSCQRESAVEEHGGRVHATDPPTSGSAAFCLSTALLGLVKGCILCGLELRLGLPLLREFLECHLLRDEESLIRLGSIALRLLSSLADVLGLDRDFGSSAAGLLVFCIQCSDLRELHHDRGGLVRGLLLDIAVGFGRSHRGGLLGEVVFRQSRGFLCRVGILLLKRDLGLVGVLLGLHRDLSPLFDVRFSRVLIVVAERDRIVFGWKQGDDEALLRLPVRGIAELLVVTHERAAIHGVTDVGAGVEVAASRHAIPDSACLIELEGLALIDRSDTAPGNTCVSAENTTLYDWP